MDKEKKIEENKKDKKNQREHTATKSFSDPSTSQVRTPHKGEKKGGEERPSSSASREAPRGKRQKNLPPLPELGQPGGRDDPKRKGLSGAGCKWYLRYLAQGFAPVDARRKAFEHKSGEAQKTPPTAQKRKRDGTTPTQKPPKKKKEAASTASSYATAVKLERIAILPREFPEHTLSADEQTAVEEALVEEMYSGWEHKIQFRGIHFRPGFILVECETPQSAEWLRIKVPQLKNWKGVELTTCKGEDIPKAHTVTIFLPRSQGQTAEKLLQLIEAQNADLRTAHWKVLSLKDEGKGQILRAGIDNLSCQTIRNNGYTIHYRFGKIPVHGIRPKEEKEEPTPGPSTETKDEQEIGGSDTPKPEEQMDFQEEKSVAEEGDDTLTEEDVTLSTD